MEKIVKQAILYDFYGELLTEHQKMVYEGLVNDNMSLTEIADEQGVSRQAIYDLVKRTDRILQDYEDRLGLAARFEQIRHRISDIDEKLVKLSEDPAFIDHKDLEIADIRRLCDEIKDLA